MLCSLKFNVDAHETHVSQILTGFKLLEDQGVLNLSIDSMNEDFRTKGLFEHNAIVEAKINGNIFVYDVADGYQSIHRKDVFDRQLDRVSYYFKRSYDSGFFEQMKNKDKVKPLGLNYYCTCKGNPYDKYIWGTVSIKEVRRFLSYWHGGKNWRDLCDYKNFVSNNHYDNYKLLFLTRLWDSSHITTEHILKHYPYLSYSQAEQEAKKQRNSLDSATQSRIRIVRALRNEFKDCFVGGVSRDSVSEELCPELIVDDTLTDKRNWMRLCRENYIGIASTGLHNSIGWKLAEYVCNGRAIITEPLLYEIPGNFAAGINYEEFSGIGELLSKCKMLMNNPEKVHIYENQNAEYYRRYLAPDIMIKNTIAFLREETLT